MNTNTSYGLAKIGGQYRELRIDEKDLVNFCQALEDCISDASENAQWELPEARDWVIEQKFQCLRWLCGIDPVGLGVLKSTLSLLVDRQPGSYASLALRMAKTFLNDEIPADLRRKWNAEQNALALVIEAEKVLRQAKKTGRAFDARERTSWRYQHPAPSQLLAVVGVINTEHHEYEADLDADSWLPF